MVDDISPARLPGGRCLGWCRTPCLLLEPSPCSRRSYLQWWRTSRAAPQWDRYLRGQQFRMNERGNDPCGRLCPDGTRVAVWCRARRNWCGEQLPRLGARAPPDLPRRQLRVNNTCSHQRDLPGGAACRLDAMGRGTCVSSARRSGARPAGDFCTDCQRCRGSVGAGLLPSWLVCQPQSGCSVCRQLVHQQPVPMAASASTGTSWTTLARASLARAAATSSAECG